MRVHGEKQTGSDGRSERANDEVPPVSTRVGDRSTGEHGTSDNHHHEGEDVNSGASRGVAL